MQLNIIYSILLKFFPKPVAIAITCAIVLVPIILVFMFIFFAFVNQFESKGVDKETATQLAQTVLFSPQDIKYYKSKINAASKAAGKFQSGNAEALALHFSKGFKNSRVEGNKLITDIGVLEFASNPYSVKYSNDKGTGIIYLRRERNGKLHDSGYSWSSK